MQTDSQPEARLMVGLTGYPNVGKSSTINALFGSKKTTVSATPGKTKHFQTLNITKNLTLVDCPGLVLPRYAASKAEMVAAGKIFFRLWILHNRSNVLIGDRLKWTCYLTLQFGFCLPDSQWISQFKARRYNLKMCSFRYFSRIPASIEMGIPFSITSLSSHCKIGLFLTTNRVPETKGILEPAKQKCPEQYARRYYIVLQTIFCSSSPFHIPA